MKLNLKIILIVSFFTNFSFAENLDQINEENIEIVEKSNFQKLEEIEDYIQDSKIKRFILDPVSIFEILKLNIFRIKIINNGVSYLGLKNYFNICPELLILNFLEISNDLLDINIFLKRINGEKNLEIINQKALLFISLISSIYKLKFLLASCKYLNKNLDSIFSFIYNSNNILEIYLKGMNFARACRK